MQITEILPAIIKGKDDKDVQGFVVTFKDFLTPEKLKKLIFPKEK